MATSVSYVIKGDTHQYEFIIATAADGTKGWLRGGLNSAGEWVYVASSEIAGKVLTSAYTLEHTERVLAATSTASTRLEAVRTEFNNSAVLADFSDVKAAAAIVGVTNLVDFLDLKEVNLPNIPDYSSTLVYANEGPFVTYNGKISSTGTTTDRQYFMSAHDGMVPGGWAAFDQIGGNQIDLGSWYFDRQVLAKVGVTLSDTNATSVLLSSSSTAVDEGKSIIFNLSTANIDPGTTIPYSITGIAAADIAGGITQGSFTVGVDGSASLAVGILADKLTEGSEILTLSANGQSISVTVNDTSLSPSSLTYTLSSAANRINEGATNNLYIKTSAPAGTVVPYKITGVSPDRISTSTLYGQVIKTSTSVEGTVTINGFGQATLPVTLVNNYAVDGASTVTVTLGDNLANTSFAVNDTSLPEPVKRYTLSPVSATVAPGSTASFALSTENVAADTQLNYSISGIPASYVSNGLLTGTVTVKSDGKAVIDVPLNPALALSDTSNQIKLSLLPTAYTPDTLSYSGAGTLTGTPVNTQNYGFVYIDAAKFTAGGTVNMSISLGSGANASSYDLFKASTPVIISGRPIDSLANAYDVSPGSVRTLTYKFGAGSESVFKLGIEGNWSSSAGTNTYTYTGTVVPNPIPAPPEPLAVSTVNIGWPIYAVSAGALSYDEGSTVVFTVSTTNVAPGTVLSYALSGVSAADIAGGALAGTTTVGIDGKGTISIRLAADKSTEAPETLTVNVQGSSTSVTVNDTSKTPTTYLLTSASPNVEEGKNASFSLSTNLPADSVVNYVVSGGVQAADIVGNSLSGSVVIDDRGTAIISLPIATDNQTEGPEIFLLTVGDKTVSTLILDTSKDPIETYVITPSSTSVDEGSVAAFTIQGINIKPGTPAAYRITGLDAADITTGQVNGQITFDGAGIATIFIPISADIKTEGTESLTVNIGNSASTIKVNDTSKSLSQYYITSAEGIVEEGRIATFVITAADAVVGTKLQYTLSGSGITNKDLSNGKLTGSVAIGADSSATIIVPIAADKTTEGDEDLTVSLKSQDVSETITIADTSIEDKLQATYSLSALESSISEGGNAEFFLSTTGVKAGTKLNYKVGGISTADLVDKKLSGSVTVGADGTATILINTASDALKEGNETLSLTINGETAQIAILDDTSVKVSEIIAAGSEVSLYRSSFGSYVLAASDLRPDDAMDNYIPLRASAIKDYTPKGIVAVLSYENGAFGLISKSSAGKNYSEQLFNADGIATTKSKLTESQLLSKETASRVDINADGTIGEVISEILDGDGDASQQDYGVYKTSSGSIVLAQAGLTEGDVPLESVPLMSSKTRGWTISKNSAIEGVALTDGGSLEILTVKSGRYSVQKFDPVTGLSQGRSSALKTAELEAREYYYDVDLTGDGKVSLVGQDELPAGWLT